MAAQALGVSERQVSRWRNGQQPRYASVVQWAHVFDRSVESFYAEPERSAA